MKMGKDGFYYCYIKRILDILCAITAMIMFCWLYTFVAILVRIRLGSPVIFKQPRPGKDEKIFTLYKFRTMTDEQDADGKLLADDIRLTKFGKILRSTSLDELPEVWNILEGDMSFIGPRPQLVCDMVFMTPEQRQRHSVRPGLSGLAQVCGRNAISWENKLVADLEYIQHITFLNDVKITLLTIKKCLCREDISAEGMETAEDLGDYLLHSGKIKKAEYDAGQNESIKLLNVGK